MTDKELDEWMRRVLRDSLETESERTADAEFQPTVGYRRQMRAMLDNPLKWARNMKRPIWKRALRVAAMFALTVSLGWMAVGPAARASIMRWIQETYETYILCRYTGEYNEILPEYGIRVLPEGYEEISRSGTADLNATGGITSCEYENPEGDKIIFMYLAMSDGTISAFSTDKADVTDVKVKGFDGKFFAARDPANRNTLMWMDTRNKLQFSIDGYFNLEDMTRMAESVYLRNMTN
ncbi:MAG: DUF4367 domain-containing protein [Oscillibacter sp.]|nr:DUF4367 domain-containing protein [Oscillibacter sp.]